MPRTPKPHADAPDSPAAASGLRLFQTMAGAAQGGAELFFERLAASFAAAGVTQTVMIKPDPERMNRLAATGVPAQGCAFSPLMAVLHKRQLATAIRKSRATVILSWMNRATGMTPRTGIPHVARLGGFYNLKYYRHCDWLVANTRGIADYLVREGVPADRVHHQINFVPDGIDGAIFDGSRHDGSRHDGPVIAALGRLHPNKAFDTLIRAFAGLDDGTLWLAGDGPDRQALAALAAELGVAERVRFLGWQEDPQAVIRGADLFVCPSRHEPFGNVIAEAMACGKPVISTSSHGGTELIEDGVNGVLVPVDDAGAMADAMRQITGDKALAGRLAAAGRSHWQKTLSPAQVTADWIAFLAKVAG